jgi:hypothetical protein
MKNIKQINILVFCIVIFSVFACVIGLTSSGGNGQYEFKSINNEVVSINGQGIYKNDSVSVTAQGKASDLVTIVLAIPLLIISLYFANKNSIRGRLLLTGTVGYFLYTFMSYAFLWQYNPLFIVYVILMSTSLFAFILCLCSFDLQEVPSYFDKKLPIKFLGGFQIFVAVAISLLWLGKIAPTIFTSSVPVGLEHYTTLVIQAMDLGFIVPATLLSGILLIKKKAMGYLLSSVIIFKAITLLSSITAMIINQAINKVDSSPIEIIVFSTFNALAIIALILLLKNIKTKKIK